MYELLLPKRNSYKKRSKDHSFGKNYSNRQQTIETMYSSFDLHSIFPFCAYYSVGHCCDARQRVNSTKTIIWVSICSHWWSPPQITQYSNKNRSVVLISIVRQIISVRRFARYVTGKKQTNSIDCNARIFILIACYLRSNIKIVNLLASNLV